MLNRNTENKVVGWQVEANVAHNSPMGAADCEPLVGTITTGVESVNRIGDKIKPKSLRVKGIVSFTPDTQTTSQNIYVRIIIAAQKSIKVGSAVLAGGVDTAHLLRTGILASPDVPFNGSTQALTYPVNKDLFRVYMDKIVKLTVGAVTGGAREQQPMYSARWSYNFKSLPSSFSFDQGSGDWVNNFAPFLAIGYAFPDGTADLNTFTRIISNTFSQLEFEDA